MINSLRNPLWWAGITLAVVISYAAGHVAQWFGESVLGFAKSPVSDIMMAIVLGMIVANVIRLPPGLGLGLRFCSSTILRVGIMLLGIRLSLLGAGRFTLVALPFVIVAIAVGLSVVGVLGRHLNLSRQMSGLIAVGTSICGATAIVATAPLIKANESEVTYSIACITLFGLVAMFFYPILGHYLFANEPALAGLFLGTSIHETAQVAGAGLMYEAQYNAPVALDIATVTKLVRNLCMIAVIPVVGILYGSDRGADSSARDARWWRLIPWFIIGFALMSALRTVGDFGDRAFGIMDQTNWIALVTFVRSTAENCLLLAMAAVGLTSMFSGLRQIGARPFLLGLFAAVLIGGVSLTLISLFAKPLIDAIGL
ncbi:MAG: putative sulfate exporter family transporter [Proteobacteria bacterium]|nr:putative sulfate exporter family transporter [Pseudomonadota bacterium]MDA0993249.1 putative sulfate exporter family transporter [Pseudomonadota bacterium]